MTLPDDAILEVVAEVLRCTRGVVRTADPVKVRAAVVPEWWDALHNALAALDNQEQRRGLAK